MNWKLPPKRGISKMQNYGEKVICLLRCVITKRKKMLWVLILQVYFISLICFVKKKIPLSKRIHWLQFNRVIRNNFCWNNNRSDNRSHQNTKKMKIINCKSIFGIWSWRKGDTKRENNTMTWYIRRRLYGMWQLFFLNV